MRVINLKVNNFARVVAIDITPGGDIVTLTGKNMAGKSSILNALWTALKGKDAAPKVPVRKGSKEAEIRVDLGKYIITRKFKNTDDGEVTTSLTVENADGARYSSPQKLLDGLIGDLSFDPLAFARSKPRDQFDALAKFVPGVDFIDIANLNRGDFEKRADINKRAKEARSAANVIVVPAELPERIDENALVNEMASATQRDQEIAAHGRKRKALSDAVNAIGRDIEGFEIRAEQLRTELAKLTQNVADSNARLETLTTELSAFPPAPEPIDAQAVATRLNEAKSANAKLDEHLRNAESKGTRTRLADSLEAESDAITARMEARNAAKEKAISEAKMPVEGVGFGDCEVLLNGVPFSQGSSAEQLRTSVAIAAAMNPTLRVIHIRDGSLLDVDSVAWIAEFAKANDLQVWCEVVGTDEKVGILIEDGQVKGAESAEKAA